MLHFARFFIFPGQQRAPIMLSLIISGNSFIMNTLPCLTESSFVQPPLAAFSKFLNSQFDCI